MLDPEYPPTQPKYKIYRLYTMYVNEGNSEITPKGGLSV